MGPICGAFRARHIGDSNTWGRNCQLDAEIREEQDHLCSRIYLNDSKNLDEKWCYARAQTEVLLLIC